MSIVFYIFAALLVYLSFRSFRGGVAYLNYFTRELAKPRREFTPFVTVIAPCKGLDEGLEENLASLVAQEYPDFEVIFVVDDAADAAVPVINKFVEAADRPHPVKLVVAARSKQSSQKVENLREAVLHADDRSEGFVFVDSDVRPGPGWLRSLVAPLEDESVGAATGYRWFVPAKPTLAGELRSAWNASIASALGPFTKGNFCWGGSTAIRRETFDRIKMRDKWLGTLSDDFALTRAVADSGLAIYFVPRALAASIENCTLRECLEFTTRQMKITRVYMPDLWKLSLFGSGLFSFVMLAAFLIVVFSSRNTAVVWAAIATLLLVAAFSIAKAWLRLKAVRMVVPSASRQALAQLSLWLLTPPLFLFNSIAALFSRRMTWRGITYELISPSETLRLDENP